MDRPGFSFLVCPDPQLLEEELARQIYGHRPQNGDWQKIVFWGDEEPGPKFWESLSQNGLFASNRALVIRNAQEWTAAVWKSVSGALASSYGSVWPFFCLEAEFEKGKFKIPPHVQKARCYLYAEKQGWIWRQQPLSMHTMRKYAVEKAKRENLSFDPSALNVFCESVRPDARAISNEINKLYLMSKNGVITADMISRDSSTPESDAFACIKKLEAGDLRGCWQEINRNASSSMLFFMISLMARELRILWQFKTGCPPRLHPAEAGAKTAIAQRLSLADIAGGLGLLADAELQVKSGKLAPEQALEVFIVEMCKIFKR